MFVLINKGLLKRKGIAVYCNVYGRKIRRDFKNIKKGWKSFS